MGRKKASQVPATRVLRGSAVLDPPSTTGVQSLGPRILHRALKVRQTAGLIPAAKDLQHLLAENFDSTRIITASLTMQGHSSHPAEAVDSIYVSSVVVNTFPYA